MPALALKYRPTTFDDLVGQLHAAQSLKNAIEFDNLAHAYLFFGSRGVGKTSTARILAKCLNCIQNGASTKPCGKCDNCLEIALGNNIDVIEMDAASNRGIEHIRNLRENARFAPMKSRYKIYIIDEVHMLTNEAFNALLKTLEEPPAHVVFILATTEKHKIPETILSRCQSFAFKKFSNEELLSRLKEILTNEGVNFDEEALLPIAAKAEGSMRDAVSLTDQVISFSGGKPITHELAANILGLAPVENYIEFLAAVRERSRGKVLSLLDNLYSEGVNLKQFLREFLDFIKNCLLIQKKIGLEKGMYYSESQRNAISQEAHHWEEAELVAAFERLYRLYNSWSYFQTTNSSENLVSLQIALMDLFERLERPSVSQLIKKLGALEEAIRGGKKFDDIGAAQMNQSATPSAATGQQGAPQATATAAAVQDNKAKGVTPPNSPNSESSPTQKSQSEPPQPKATPDASAPASAPKAPPPSSAPSVAPSSPPIDDDLGAVLQKEFGGNEEHGNDGSKIFKQ